MYYSPNYHLCFRKSYALVLLVFFINAVRELTAKRRSLGVGEES